MPARGVRLPTTAIQVSRRTLLIDNRLLTIVQVPCVGPQVACRRAAWCCPLCPSRRLPPSPVLCETPRGPQSTTQPRPHGVTDAICPPALRGTVVAAARGARARCPAAAPRRASHGRAPAATQPALG